MKDFFMYTKWLVYLMVSLPMFAANQMQKLFHHEMDLVPGKPALELGKIVFYFDSQPIIKEVEKSLIGKNWQQIRFFLPSAVITSSELKKSIADLARFKHPFYSMKISQVTNPSNGVQIDFLYDPAHVSYSYLFFDAITKAKGVEFRIFNKRLLESLKKKSEGAVLRTAQITNPIIIDCGHGGADPGTKGFGNLEKNISLAVGKELEKQLKANKIPVILTRQDDSFLPIDTRTQLACKNDGALLISLHANNCANPAINGLETYYVNHNCFTDDYYGLQTCIDVVNEWDRMHSAQCRQLAGIIHENILQEAKKNGYSINNRLVKTAMAQVIRGVAMPAVLIELDFLSNERSAKLLADKEYQQVLAKGIYNGLDKFMNLKV